MRKVVNNNCTLYRGDCVSILKTKIPDKSVNLIFADPPYNIGKKFSKFTDKWKDEKSYYNWCYSWLELCVSKLTDNGSLYLMSSTQAMPVLDLYPCGVKRKELAPVI